eukprot:3811297-Heterocapsa_arctica.AAC.1
MLLKIPFGSLIDFTPPKVLLKDLAKFGKTTMPGVMLGYHVSVGGKWHGDYLVAPLQDFQIHEYWRNSENLPCKRGRG